MSKDMDKVYNPEAMESERYQYWVESGCFQPQGEGDPFSVVIPPPNVTGVLHMGHALNITLQDSLVRYKRMNGYRVCWVPGTDHAGIATQNVVEKALQKEGKSRHEMTRETFLDHVWTWKNQYGGQILEQIKRLGASVDWSRERFTMDDGCKEAVLDHFVSLHEQGYIYRGEYIVNWCPKNKTAISDIEVEHKEVQGHLWHIRYPFKDKPDEGIIVATTRPETMFGDVAVAVHPNDDRYKQMIGKHLILPLQNKEIPIVADRHVDKDFGSGAVKVTPAHDPNDFEIGNRHDLPRVKVMDESAVMNDQVPEAYQGLDRYACRKKVVADLEEAGLLVRIEDHTHSVGYNSRSGAVIEPYLSKQWFIDMKKLAKPAIDAVKSGDITFTPKRWEKLYFEWMESIRNWCVSRQIWWGHQIPVWYCDTEACEEIVVSRETPTTCTACGGDTLRQDEDVLDTWFSSALWPFSTLGWPNKTADLEAFYPTSVLVTGYDIITFWVSRMITMGVLQTKQAPFSNVYIHGLVRDSSGKKMSKSLGNAVNPLDLIDSYGADALRYSLASLSTLGGQDIKFSEEHIRSCRNFANKVWNVSRYIMMIIEGEETVIQPEKALKTTMVESQWVLSRFQATLNDINEAYDNYNFALAADRLWEFTWNVFCDWYTEMSKINKQGSVEVLTYILLNILKIAHPMMPFITEDIWQKIRATKKVDGLSEQLITAAWPVSNPELVNPTLDTTFEKITETVREIRNMRKQLNISPGKEATLILVAPDTADYDALKAGKPFIQKLAKISEVTLWRSVKDKPQQASSSVVQKVAIFMPLQGLIDIDKERTRLQKKYETLSKEVEGTKKKLTNKQFLEKAPTAVVDKIKGQQSTLLEEQGLLEKQLEQLTK